MMVTPYPEIALTTAVSCAHSRVLAFQFKNAFSHGLVISQNCSYNYNLE